MLLPAVFYAIVAFVKRESTVTWSALPGEEGEQGSGGIGARLPPEPCVSFARRV